MPYPDNMDFAAFDRAMGVHRFAEGYDDDPDPDDAPDVTEQIAAMTARAERDPFYGAGIWAFDAGQFVNRYVRGSLEARAFEQGFAAARATQVERRLQRAFLIEAEARAVADEIDNNQKAA